MSEKNTRREVLKKSAAATTVLAGGLAAGSGSTAAATSDGSIQAQGQGTFKVIIETDSIDVQVDGVSLTTEQDGDFWIIEGEVNGAPNTTPDDYVYITFDGYNGYYNEMSDDGVNLDITVY